MGQARGREGGFSAFQLGGESSASPTALTIRTKRMLPGREEGWTSPKFYSGGLRVRYKAHVPGPSLRFCQLDVPYLWHRGQTVE